MAHIKEIESEKIRVAIWSINEDIEELKKLLNSERIAKKIEERYSSVKRQREQFVSHLLVKHLFGEAKEIKHHESGAPYIEANSKHISISHSRKSIALAVSDKNIGIDIEERDRKQLSLIKKFTTPTEQEWIASVGNTKEQQLIAELIWSAKEAIYKLAGIEGLSFENDIEISPFNITPATTTFTASYLNKKCSCTFQLIENELLVICSEKKR